MTGVLKSSINTGGSYSKSSPFTLMKPIFNSSINSFTTFIPKNHNKIFIKIYFNLIYNSIFTTLLPIIFPNIHFSLVKIIYKNHKMSFNIIIYNIFNFIIFNFRLINLIVSNIKMIIIICNNSLCKFMINNNSRICRFRLILTTP